MKTNSRSRTPHEKEVDGVHNGSRSTENFTSEAHLADCRDQATFNDASSRTTDESSESKHFKRTTRRINLQRFTVYNSSTTMYIVGSNAKESLFRIIEITSDPSGEGLSIIEDKNYFYTRNDVIELMKGLNESIQGGIHKIAHAFGVLGFIKFTCAYYLCIVTKCSRVAIVGGHYIYHIDETKLIPLALDYKRPYKYSDEDRLLSIFKYLDLGKTFYFSYTYDITNSLQTNITRMRPHNKIWREGDNSSGRSKVNFNERFVWNKLLLKPIHDTDIATYEWFQPIVHGFIDQASISIYGRKLFITIIARRSHHFAGARFLKRGVNHRGDVANEVETEQIVSDMLTSSFHDPKYGLFANPRLTSFVQHRGSIPLYWTQDLNRLPKPPIEINLSDPYYQSSALHFNDLIERYGSPIIIVNLIKTKEKHPRESKLSKQFVNCVKYLNQFMPKSDELRYYSFDMSKHSKKNADVIGPLEAIASTGIETTGFFHNGRTLGETKLQRGIIRTNCIDCLDRTNAAQFVICKEALAQQLKSLGFLENSANLEYDSDLLNILTEMFHDHGDTIAVQYGGSNLVNTMDSYRRINQWSSHTRDILNSIKRIYSNSFMDVIRQEAINLFLGNYVYKSDKPKLWELQNDYYLHNRGDNVYSAKKLSYLIWYRKRPSGVEFEDTTKNTTAFTQLDHNELSDYWFNECYIPRKFQSFSEVFQFNMNSNARYFPSGTNEAKAFDYSPFGVRKGKFLLKGSRQDDEATKSMKRSRSPEYVQDGGFEPANQTLEEPRLKTSFIVTSSLKADHDLFRNNLTMTLDFFSQSPRRITLPSSSVSEADVHIYQRAIQPPSFKTSEDFAFENQHHKDAQTYWSYLEKVPKATSLIANESYFG